MGESTNIALEGLKIDLPALPHTFLMAMGLSRDADQISIDEVVNVIQNDPGAVARVLRVVNSAYYGMRKEVTSIHKAVVALGPQAVLGIVMSVSLEDIKGQLHVSSGSTFQRLIRHSIATGYIARKIVNRSAQTKELSAEGRDFSNETFMLGLLHDFGKIVLFYNFPEEASEFYERSSGMDKAVEIFLAEERQLFGIDHVAAGKYLMQELNFLTSMERAVTLHHNHDVTDELSTNEQFLLDVVVASNIIANTIGLESNRIISRKACMESPFWDRFFEKFVPGSEDKSLLFDELFGLKEEVTAYVSEVL